MEATDRHTDFGRMRGSRKGQTTRNAGLPRAAHEWLRGLGSDSNRSVEVRPERFMVTLCKRCMSAIAVAEWPFEMSIGGFAFDGLNWSMSADWTSEFLLKEVAMDGVRERLELAAEQSPEAVCPSCEKQCRLKPAQRTVESVDGPVELTEWKGHCPTCRRDFFPSA